MLKIDLYNHTGIKEGSAQLPEGMFNAKVNDDLMAQAVSIYLGNQRQGGAKTQRRSEVSLTTRKWFRQKGTGRARHGAQSAPIFVGGGVAHGPTGVENYTRKLSKKMRRRALSSALTHKLNSGEVRVIKNLAAISKVKEASMLLRELNLAGSKITVVIPHVDEAIIKSWRNMANVNIVQAPLLHTYSALNGGTLLLMNESITVLASRLIDTPEKKQVSTTASAEISAPLKKASKVAPVKKKKISKKVTVTKKD